MLCCWELQPGDTSAAVALEMILNVVWGSDLRHFYIEGSFADLTCSGFAMQAPLRALGDNFWKITIKTLHFSECIIGGLFSAQSQESVAISRYQDTASVVTVVTLWPPWVCTQEMDECPFLRPVYWHCRELCRRRR